MRIDSNFLCEMTIQEDYNTIKGIQKFMYENFDRSLFIKLQAVCVRRGEAKVDGDDFFLRYARHRRISRLVSINV